ncbi:alanine racemase [Antrihabitans cavernicola]|uniref:Alanine racemase n=1 Tax=Antrihabitans cavernicola TaxID=2495913 RepID=A0A5A7SDE3_9NOCA|nr:alanine racemase [Spelaeibacter cavernicola]KAA0022757.1 alanine racemase [Spelaeibacter cavernicola]
MAVSTAVTSPIPAPQAEAVVDLDAIAHNTRVLAEHAGDAAVMVVVKADGYNHGAFRVAQTALAAGAREVGVTTVAEAVELRAAGIEAPILCWLNTSDVDFAAAIRADVEIGVSSTRHLAAVAAAAKAAGTPATVSIKVDSGLNRNGASPTEYPRLLDDLVDLARAGSVRLRGIFSHLAQADEPHHPMIDIQRQRFLDAVAAAKARNLIPELLHLSNSAATLTRPDLHFDMIRPGIAVYGLTPIPELGDFGLRPAMTLQTRVALVKDVARGEGVSYGHEWIAPRDTMLALLPVGYADGVSRALGGRFDVLLGGARHSSVGRVCMDQVLVDLGPDGAGVSEGDTAVLFGPGDRGEPRAQDWADLLGTIHYEVVTSPRGRIVRRYIGGEL